MDKTNIVNTFTAYVEQLRNRECSQKEKIACFQHIADCITHPALASHHNYATHCSKATNVLLLFCEDLDSVVRMCAEENLNKIFRTLEKTRVSRILMDLYGEIKRNGNQRSLRISLNLFAHYAPQIKEKQIKWYALRLLHCMLNICQRKETQLCETLCEFVKNFGRNLQHGLTDSETCKLFEAFMANIGAECAVKRRCSSQNCISLIENSQNKSLMAKHGLSKVFELLLADQQTNTVLGALGFLRLLVPLIIRGFKKYVEDDDSHTATNKRSSAYSTQSNKFVGGSPMPPMTSEIKKIVEIYDYCLHLLSTSNNSNHSIINAALEVINALLQALDTNSCCNTTNNATAKTLQQLLSNQQLQLNEFLRRRKSLKNQIFQLKNYEVTTTEAPTLPVTAAKNTGILVSTTVAAKAKTTASPTMATPSQHTQGANTEVAVDTPGGSAAEAELLLKNLRIISEHQETLNANVSEEVAYKLDMQKIANAKMLLREQQEHQNQKLELKLELEKEHQHKVAVMSLSPGNAVGINVGSGTSETTSSPAASAPITMAAFVAVEKNMDADVDNHDEEQQTAKNMATTAEQTKHHIRSTARSISECIEYDAFALVDDATGIIAGVDEDEDDFTTLSEISEPKQTYALTTTIDVDNLIDAIDANTDSANGISINTNYTKYNPNSMAESDGGAEHLHSPPQNLLTVSAINSNANAFLSSAAADDKSKSEVLSDFDNESFNSIDFEAEIRIGGKDGSAAGNTSTSLNAGVNKTIEPDANAESGSKGSGDTIGSFFNNLISHSSAASESVSKLFRQSSTTKSSSIINPQAEKADAISTTSMSAADNLSFISTTSSNKNFDVDDILSATPDKFSRQQSLPSINDDTFATTPSVTASTAVLQDISKNSTDSQLTEDVADADADAQPEVELRRKPNANPFLLENSPLKQTIFGPPLVTIKIGTIYEQSLIYYTARLIAARFLLTGDVKTLQSDTNIRVSIKNLALCVISQCVRLQPIVLQISLEITETELSLLEQIAQSMTTEENSKGSSTSGSPNEDTSATSNSSNIATDYEELLSGDKVDFTNKFSAADDPSDLLGSSLLLEIKDDHFGKSTCDYLLNQPLSKSADPVLFTIPITSQRPATSNKKVNYNLNELSKSDIVTSNNKKSSTFKITEAVEDTPPSMLPPRPPKRTKSMRKSIGLNLTELQGTNVAPCTVETRTQSGNKKEKQYIRDILLYYNHLDPILRGGVQQIIGNFIQSTAAGIDLKMEINLQHLLAILIKGLQDDIHTVVIQALNALNKIFPHVMTKYLTIPPYNQQIQQEHEKRPQEQQQQQQHQQQQQQQQQQRTEKEPMEKKYENNVFIQNQHDCTNDVKHPTQGYSIKATKTNITTTTKGIAATIANIAPSATTSIATASSRAAATRKQFTDNDELIAALLNAFQLQSNCDDNNDQPSSSATDEHFVKSTIIDADVDIGTCSVTTKASCSVSGSAYGASASVSAGAGAGVVMGMGNFDGTFFISPKLLLDKLRLCYHNKYWLVQNKYAEVISNLNYSMLRSYYGTENNFDDNRKSCLNSFAPCTSPDDDVVSTYENIFLDELLQLIGDDDFRVREHAAECLCRFIIRNAKQHHKMMTQKSSSSNISGEKENLLTNETYNTNLHLLWDFLDYHLFCNMSIPFRNLCRVNSSIAPPLLELQSTTATAMPSATLSMATSNSLSGIVNGGALATGTRTADHSFAVYAMCRQTALEEKLLSKVLYRLTNKLMELHDKNLQFGIIYTLKLLLHHFSFVDYQRAWTEFNFMEICIKFSYYNCVTSMDLNCQNDLIDVMGKLMAGAMLSETPNRQQHQQQLELLLTHVLKIINIYYHLFTNQKPLLFAKVQKNDIFINAKELAIVQSVGYFGNDYVYIKLYNTLRCANDSYKITINQESGSLLISLLKTCLNTLSFCIELRAHSPQQGSSSVGIFPSNTVLKLIEEILQYLTKLINYAPCECIACLRQLLKYLFAQNYGNRQQDYYGAFMQPYFVAKAKGQRQCSTIVKDENIMYSTQTINSSAMMTPTTMTSSTFAHNKGKLIATHADCKESSSVTDVQDYRLFGELFVTSLNMQHSKSDHETECSRHIKLFEPLVIYSLTLFMKSNSVVQAPVLDLLVQLLHFNVTYSILDSKNVIFEQILSNLELIESGIARNTHIIIPPMIKFLIQLTHKSDRKLITIPKIISITNNLLANNAIRESAVLALKALTYEIFFISPNIAAASVNTVSTADLRAPFQSPISRSPISTPTQPRRSGTEEAEAAAAVAEMILAHNRELDTQKEVVLGMLEKFIDAVECQQTLALLLLRERCAQQLEIVQQENVEKLGCGFDIGNKSSEGAMKGHTMYSTLLQDPDALYAIVCRAMCEGRIPVQSWHNYFLWNAFFRNNDKSVLADSKTFLALLQIFFSKDMTNFSDLSLTTIILENVILKIEEIYLVNHIKLYLKNNPEVQRDEFKKQQQQQQQQNQGTQNWMHDGPSTSSAAAFAAAQNQPSTLLSPFPLPLPSISSASTAVSSLSPSSSSTAAVAAVATAAAAAHKVNHTVSEINYFAKVLYEKLENCLSYIIEGTTSTTTTTTTAVPTRCCYDAQYCGLVVRFVRALHDICCCSLHKDGFQAIFRNVLAESEFLDKYYNLLLMHGTFATPTAYELEQDALMLLQVEVFKLLSAMKLVDPLVLLQQIQAFDIKWNVQWTLLREVCLRNPNPMDWNLQQVRQLFNETFLNILIAEHFAFVCNLCKVDEEFCSLLQNSLLQHAKVLEKTSIRKLLRLILRITSSGNRRCCSIQCTAKFLQFLAKLHRIHSEDKILVAQLERLARRIIVQSTHDKNAIYDSFMHNVEEEMEDYLDGQLEFLLLNDLENLQLGVETRLDKSALEKQIIDEKWLFAQLIKFSTQSNYDLVQVTKILLDIQSENKLHSIFNNLTFDVPRVLWHTIAISLQTMLTTFRNDCMQHNPHIHYMQPNPLARVSLAVLMARLGAIAIDREVPLVTNTSVKAIISNVYADAGDANTTTVVHLSNAVIALIENIKQIEMAALIYIESKFMEKFLREHLLRPDHIAILLSYLNWCCKRVKRLLLTEHQHQHQRHTEQNSIGVLLRCIEVLLQQKLIWNELNQIEKVPLTTTADKTTADSILSISHKDMLLCNVIDVLVLLLTKSMRNTVFYKKYKTSMIAVNCTDTLNRNLSAEEIGDMNTEEMLATFAPKAIFVAKWIEAKLGFEQLTGTLSASYITGHISGTNGSSLTAEADNCSMNSGNFNDFIGLDVKGAQVSMQTIESIGISILRMNQFYAYAVTPHEIIQQSLALDNVSGSHDSPHKRSVATAIQSTKGILSTIPVERLSDVDVLRKFIKRLSIFGFTTRQQFEEYFMTFLLLINKVYDENMVDQQEQFQIKSTCLEAILELLITYKTFPFVGDKVSSYFHHTTRWSRINCDSISLKKLHKVQLLVSASNVFYHPNLERQLMTDTVIGTKLFNANQYDLNFIWQQMEAYAQPTTAMTTHINVTSSSSSGSSSFPDQNASSGTENNEAAIRNSDNENTATKNYRYFTAQSGVDFKSSSQLIFDVLMQIIEHNHILVLPNLVKFCEICESRDQIKWIKDKAFKLQETIPMDDTISHQHLIYLLCKTQAMLIPTLGELQQLCILICNYLKSSHIFIRNATLNGLLSLLESCSKTNTTIGKLSEELTLLRDLIVGYINRHGIIDESEMQCSDMHTKLVWTLNYCLIEWTSKFVPQCNLLSNAIIAASNFLRKTNKEDVYLCVLHGLERLVVIGSSGNGSAVPGGIANAGGSNSSNLSVGIVTPILRQKIEKLALDLVKLENEKFSIPALKLLLTCMYVGSAKQLANTELSNGIVQDDPEIIAQQTDKVDILLHCIKSSTRDAAWIYGQVLCQIIRDLVPPNEILTKVIKEFLAINQPHCDVIAMVVYQVFRCAIDSAFLQMLQDWLICSLPTFLALPEQKGVWGLCVIFLSASINLHLIKLFPVVLGAKEFRKLGQHEIALFVTAAQDFFAGLSNEQKLRFLDAFKKFEQNQVYAKMLRSL
ncbi:uncharacterized protein LOC119681023 [Teleopsis dalmanni]|uniref:uncharacterized protein LOC119681023 n=1 Tax=Teleopsis dalmanni TaxID=139649 RepID=UPI0018CF0D03|nr:uncharacterized protein LOC119681023 [Teleopsis dalmanni]